MVVYGIQWRTTCPHGANFLMVCVFRRKETCLNKLLMIVGPNPGDGAGREVVRGNILEE